MDGMNDFMRLLAGNIARKRKELGWTQQQLADTLEMSWQTVARIETGRQWPSDKTLQKIAHAFHCYPYELFAPADQRDLGVDVALRVLAGHLGYSVDKKA